MLKPANVRLNIHETDYKYMCCKIYAFSYKLIPEINNEHVLKGAFEGIKSGPYEVHFRVDTDNVLMLQQ